MEAPLVRAKTKATAKYICFHVHLRTEVSTFRMFFSPDVSHGQDIMDYNLAMA